MLSDKPVFQEIWTFGNFSMMNVLGVLMAIFKKVKPGELNATLSQPQYTVLLVDDEPDNLNVLRSILGGRYNIMQAADGQEALDMVRAMPDPEQLTLVVSDQRMPRLTGVQLCEKLWEILPDTIRIIVTGYIDIDAIVDSVNRARIYKFIIKPFDRHDFELTVQRAIETYESKRKFNNEVNDIKQRLKQCEQALQQRDDALKVAHTRLAQLGASASVQPAKIA
jgi:two-component system cell cycle response regulator